jgi:hypothetical protein
MPKESEVSHGEDSARALQDDLDELQRARASGQKPPAELLDRLAAKHFEVFGSYERFWETVNRGGVYDADVRALRGGIVRSRLEALRPHFEKLLDVDLWSGLRDTPPAYNKELTRILKEIAKTMKQYDAIPPHRPIKNNGQEIHDLVKSGRSYGQIALRLHVARVRQNGLISALGASKLPATAITWSCLCDAGCDATPCGNH